MRAEAPAPSLTSPEGKADKEASQSPAEQRPPHGNLLRAGLQAPPLHLTLALVLPGLLLSLSLLHSRLSESAPPCRGPLGVHQLIFPLLPSPSFLSF